MAGITSGRRISLMVLATTIAMPVAIGRASAQAIANGLWRGELVGADRESLPVNFLVEQHGRNQLMTLKVRGQPDVVMGGLTLRKGWELSFTWAAGGGAFYFCRLTRRDPNGPFDGRCEDNRVMSGSGPLRVSLTIFPPPAHVEPAPSAAEAPAR